MTAQRRTLKLKIILNKLLKRMPVKKIVPIGGIRPIPLSDIEIRSLKISDSIKSAKLFPESASDSKSASKKKEKSKFIKAAGEILSGHSWADTTGFRFTFDGLIDLKRLGFNSVDGFKYGLNFSISKSWKHKSTLLIAPDINWAFNREKLMWGVNANYSFDKIKIRQLY